MHVSDIWKWLEEVTDPEVPVLTIVDLGVVRAVEVKDEKVEVIITPTYSGCPAMDVIGQNIRQTLANKGVKNPKVTLVLSPAWTTDWMSAQGKEKLKAYGIAPPMEESADKMVLFSTPKPVPCPRCNSTHTKLVSQFGSTACKALHQCKDCLEPFDYFKCLK